MGIGHPVALVDFLFGATRARVMFLRCVVLQRKQKNTKTKKQRKQKTKKQKNKKTKKQKNKKTKKQKNKKN
jgi:hypothetical protein